jgi:hypothetical protein
MDMKKITRQWPVIFFLFVAFIKISVAFLRTILTKPGAILAGLLQLFQCMKSTFIFLPLFLTLFHYQPGAGDYNKLYTTTSDGVAINKTVLLQLVNQVRKSGCTCAGKYYPPVPTLQWNDQLEKAAMAHSQDMSAKKYFSHTAPDGSNGGVRIERAGYHWMAYGENIASGYKSEQEVIRGWLSSPGHCKNIMNKNYREMGVARAGNYWTQTFGAR